VISFRIVSTLILKDLSLFSKNRLYAVVTPLALLAYLVIYFVMPSSIDETLEIGIYTPGMAGIFEGMQRDGLKTESVESEEALRDAVVDGDYVVGVALSNLGGVGQKPQVTLYFASGTLDETKEAVQALLTTVWSAQAGVTPPIEFTEEILGPDMVGSQIAYRDRLVPLLAIFLILVETFGLATLISEEVERRTIQALLVTPVSLQELFTAKAFVGVGLAFIQAGLFLAIVGGMNHEPLIILVALVLGAMLVTGIGFLMAALGKDLLSVMGWGLVALVPLSIPAFGIMFTGTVSGWVEFIPSYYLVDTVYQVTNLGMGWGDVYRNLLILLGINVVIMWIGVLVLRRKLQ